MRNGIEYLGHRWVAWHGAFGISVIVSVFPESGGVIYRQRQAIAGTSWRSYAEI